MPEKYDVTWNEIVERAAVIADLIQCDMKGPLRHYRVYPVPRGGIPVALALVAAGMAMKRRILFEVVEQPNQADFIIDDIYDSGSTKTAHKKYERPFYTFFCKSLMDIGPRDWVVFPWERVAQEAGPEENITRILEYIGEDPAREGLIDTPRRVVKSYDEIFGGYKQDPATLMKVFEDGSCDEMVILKDIEFYSCCEHHMQPFFGKAHIAYIPNGKIIGISKLSRLLEVYARRLQVQERLTQQVTQALETYLVPLGAACVIEAKHFCMVCRGVRKQNSTMITSSLTGAFKEPATRAEFMSMLH